MASRVPSAGAPPSFSDEYAAQLTAAPRKLEAVYSYPYQNHATMEPMNTTAFYTADKCEVWVPTQNGEAALAATSEAAGLPHVTLEIRQAGGHDPVAERLAAIPEVLEAHTITGAGAEDTILHVP